MNEENEQPHTSQVPTPVSTQLPSPSVPPLPYSAEASYDDPGLYDDEAAAEQPDEAVTWTAAEFVAHPKSVQWYMILASCVAAAAIVVLLLTRDIISSIVIIICGVVFGVYAKRKPRQLTYLLDRGGLTIANKFYPYGQFRSYSVGHDESGFSTVTLMPLRRFAPGLILYIDPDHEEPIVAVLSRQLPIDTHKLDMFDRFMKRIRF